MRLLPGLRRAALALGSIGAAIVVACSEPAAPPAALAPAPGADLFGVQLGLLQCSPLAPDTATALIGPQGGTITVGPHAFVVPAGALAHEVAITATIVAGSTNRVHFEPEGLAFNVPASLTLSYANCGLTWNLVPKQIAYTNDLLQILEFVPSADNLLAQKVTGDIRHFSDYAVAW